MTSLAEQAAHRRLKVGHVDPAPRERPDIAYFYFRRGENVVMADIEDVDALVPLRPRFDHACVRHSGRRASASPTTANACPKGTIALVITPRGIVDRRSVASPDWQAKLSSYARQ